MMTRRLSRIALQGMAAAAALALAACGAQPYPNPEPQPPPPPPPLAPLAGAPLAPLSSSSITTTQTYSYSSAASTAADAPVIIAMAPIPNPGRGERTSRYVSRGANGAATTTTRTTTSSYRYIAPVHPRAAAAPHPVGLAHPRAAVAPHPVGPAHPVAKVAAKPVLKPAAKVAAPPKVAAAAKPAAPALNTAVPPAPKDANAQGASPLGDRATRLAALESTLADTIHKGAELKVPPAFTAGKAADVTLTIPADFGQTVHDEAAKNDLSDAAASVNLTAVLSGDGFAATPDTAQSQPLTPGQPTEFHWSVTAQEGAKGPLHADVGADLLGAGSDVLNMGSVQAGSAFGLGFLKSNRMLGVGILAVLAVLVLAWLARGRSGPSRSASARREARRARSDRPVMLGDSEL
jgi:hypothetical protein